MSLTGVLAREADFRNTVPDFADSLSDACIHNFRSRGCKGNPMVRILHVVQNAIGYDSLVRPTACGRILGRFTKQFLAQRLETQQHHHQNKRNRDAREEDKRSRRVAKDTQGIRDRNVNFTFLKLFF